MLASPGRSAWISASANCVAANCSAIDSRRTRVSEAASRASSIAVRASDTRCSAGGAPLIERAQLGIGFLECAARALQARLDVQAPRERFGEAPLELQDRGIAACELALELRAARRELRALLRHALQAHREGILGGAHRLAADEKIARRELRRLRRGARRHQRLARLVAIACICGCCASSSLRTSRRAQARARRASVLRASA
jgi:hypothetical protein